MVLDKSFDRIVCSKWLLWPVFIFSTLLLLVQAYGPDKVAARFGLWQVTYMPPTADDDGNNLPKQ